MRLIITLIDCLLLTGESDYNFPLYPKTNIPPILFNYCQYHGVLIDLEIPCVNQAEKAILTALFSVLP